MPLPNPPLRRDTLPGKIIREAPPGPEMTREQFEQALEDQRADALRFRWIMRNFGMIFEWPIEKLQARQFRQLIDENMDMDQ